VLAVLGRVYKPSCQASKPSFPCISPSVLSQNQIVHHLWLLLSFLFQNSHQHNAMSTSLSVPQKIPKTRTHMSWNFRSRSFAQTKSRIAIHHDWSIRNSCPNKRKNTNTLFHVYGSGEGSQTNKLFGRRSVPFSSLALAANPRKGRGRRRCLRRRLCAPLQNSL